MKQTLLLVLVLFCSYLASGQVVIEISPDTLRQSFSEDLSDDFLTVELYATVTNTSGQEVALRWERFELDKPEVWQTQVCDNITCWLPEVYSNIAPDLPTNSPVILEADSSMQLIFYVLPNGLEGTGFFALDFALASVQEDILASVIYEVEVNDIVTSTFRPIEQQLKIYPNPSSSFFQLENAEGVSHVIVYNLLGQPVKRFEALTGARYPVYDLPDGNYVVSLVDRQQKPLKVLRLNKQQLRP